MDTVLLIAIIAPAVAVVSGLLRVSYQFGSVVKGLSSLERRVTRLETRINHYQGGE